MRQRTSGIRRNILGARSGANESHDRGVGAGGSIPLAMLVLITWPVSERVCIVAAAAAKAARQVSEYNLF
jgi:hypothetical protein